MDNSYVIEASTLGLAPGHWPFTIRNEALFGAATFTRDRAEFDAEHELLYVIYIDVARARTLRVLND